MLLAFCCLRIPVDIVLYGRQLVHFPSFADRKASVRILSSLVDSYQLSIVYRDDNDSLFLVLWI